MVVEVVLDGERLLCDPGFGMSLMRPIPMADGAEDDYLPGWRYQLRRTDDGHWALYRMREEGWEVAHTTDELEVKPVDVVMGHHYTSTYPGSHFTTSLMIAKHLPGRHVTVTHESLTIRTPGSRPSTDPCATVSWTSGSPPSRCPSPTTNAPACIDKVRTLQPLTRRTSPTAYQQPPTRPRRMGCAPSFGEDASATRGPGLGP